MKANDSGLSMYQMRLLTCADIVRRTKTPFNMMTWECGTSHCAVGDYCVAGVSDMVLDGGRPTLPTGETNSNAVTKHFAISVESHVNLFGATRINAGRSRAEVADRIEQFALHRHQDAIRTEVTSEAAAK